MSEQSDFSQDIQVGWIQWFCGLDDHQFFCQVDHEYIQEKFNLFGLKNRVKKFDEALQMILRHNPPQQQEIQNPKFLQVYQQATDLYGLIHSRYIKTPQGLALMRQRFLHGKFGQCPRVLCERQNAIPIGISQDLKLARVKIYCPRCKDIYSPKKKFADVDGAYFGTSFPHLLLMTYPDIQPLFKKEEYEPKIFGFKIVEEQNQNHEEEAPNLQLKEKKYISSNISNKQLGSTDKSGSKNKNRNKKKKR